MARPSSSLSTLPENYDDQIQFLHERIDDLNVVFAEFINAHDDLNVFEELRDPLGMLSICHIMVRSSLEEFCQAVKYVKFYASSPYRKVAKTP